MANQWFKFYGGEYLSDPKIGSLNLGERACWTALLCHANLTENKIKYVTENSLMLQAGVNPVKPEWNDTVGVLQKLVEMEMIQIDNGMITLLNWEKRQEIHSESYERLKRWREKKRIETELKRNDNGKNRIEEKRIEKKREDTNTPAQEARDFFTGLNSEVIYSEVLEKTNAPPEIIKREFGKFTNYWTEKNKSGTKQKWEQQDTFEVRRRLATWLGRVKEFNKVEFSKGRGLA